jgi:dUTP pyrophosphatase
MTLKIKKLTKEAITPRYAHPGDAGMDLFSNEEAVIRPHERKLISTGLAMAIPEGFVGLIWDRSGIASKHGLKTMAGVVDSNYRGEVKILMHNLSPEEFKVEKGMRIAQMLVQPIAVKGIQEVDDLEETNRGDSGFGSTGIR